MRQRRQPLPPWLANLSALMTDNTLGLRAGTDNDESYEINLQPVYSINFEELGLV